MGCLKSEKINIPSARINALNSLPINLVAAPGAGKAILFIAGFVRYNFVSAAFPDDRQIYAITDTADVPQAVALGLLQSVTNVSHEFLTNIVVPVTDQKQVIENKALQIKASANQSASGGDGSIDVYVDYEIVDL